MGMKNKEKEKSKKGAKELLDGRAGMYAYAWQGQRHTRPLFL